MPQIQPLFDLAVEAAEKAEDEAKNLMNRRRAEGFPAHDEEAVWTAARRSVIAASRNAHNARKGIATIRCGDDSWTVTDLNKHDAHLREGT